MTLDLSPLLGFELPPIHFSWTARDAYLYALAIGAGEHETELPLTWASSQPQLFPTFGVLPARMQTLRHANLPAGITIPNDSVLHASHGIEVVDRDLPLSATVTTTGRVVEVLRVKSGAIVIRHSETRTDDGRLLWRHRVASHVRGATSTVDGGGLRFSVPQGPPDLTTTIRILPQQALLYGLTGDPNPIHGDPRRAPAGSSRPILHGLCTFGMVARVLLLVGEKGAWSTLREFDARFRAPVVPGDQLIVLGWRSADGSWSVQARSEGGQVVLDGRMAAGDPMAG